MKIMNNLFGKKLLFLCLMLLSLTGYAQNFTLTLANVQHTSTTLDVDLMLTIVAPAQGVRLASVSTGINYNTGILNGGTPCTTLNCGSWALVPGSTSSELTANGGLNNMSLTTRTPYGQLRIVQTNKTTTLVDLPTGTYRVGTFRLTNTTAWTASSDVQMWLSPTNVGGLTNSIIGFYPFGAATPLANYTVTAPAGGTGLTLTHTTTNRLSAILNGPTCPTAAVAKLSSRITMCWCCQRKCISYTYWSTKPNFSSYLYC